MILEERNEFETLFENLLHFIEQRNKLIEGSKAVLYQGLALLNSLKQAPLPDKENSHLFSSASTPPPIPIPTSTLPDTRPPLTTKYSIPILLAKPSTTPNLQPSKLPSFCTLLCHLLLHQLPILPLLLVLTPIPLLLPINFRFNFFFCYFFSSFT